MKKELIVIVICLFTGMNRCFCQSEITIDSENIEDSVLVSNSENDTLFFFGSQENSRLYQKKRIFYLLEFDAENRLVRKSQIKIVVKREILSYFMMPDKGLKTKYNTNFGYVKNGWSFVYNPSDNSILKKEKYKNDVLLR